MDLRAADFTLYRRISRDTALEGRDRIPGHKGHVKAEGTQLFVSVFIGKICLQESQAQDQRKGLEQRKLFLSRG